MYIWKIFFNCKTDFLVLQQLRLNAFKVGGPGSTQAGEPDPTWTHHNEDWNSHACKLWPGQSTIKSIFKKHTQSLKTEEKLGVPTVCKTRRGLSGWKLEEFASQ